MERVSIALSINSGVAINSAFSSLVHRLPIKEITNNLNRKKKNLVNK